MSFWDNVKKFAQPYADDEYDEYDDDEYMDDYDEAEQPSRRASRRQAAPAPMGAPMTPPMNAPMNAPMNQNPGNNFGGFNPAPAAPMNAPVAAPVKPMNAPAPSFNAPAANFSAPATGFNGAVLNRSSKQEVVLFRPGSFNDTTKAADDLKANKAVIVNMENVDKAMARRVVDFLSGCVYALEGDVKKIAQSAYLFCPHNVGVIGDLEAMQAEVESYI